MLSLKRPERPNASDKYTRMRWLCLGGIVLLSFYAITEFPGFYERGLDAGSVLMIGFVMLSGIALLHIERGCSSRSGRNRHDWASAGGSMYAFSWAGFYCSGCGAKLCLADLRPDGVKFLAPGRAAEGEAAFICPHCGRRHKGSELVRAPERSSRLRGEAAARLLPQVKKGRAWRLSKEYTRRYLLVTLILLLAEVSCAWMARTRPVNLLLPLFVGYFLYVSFINALTALATRYYVTDEGVVQRSPWGYRLYGFSEKASLVSLDGNGGAAWGLLTEAENLLVSPLIDDWRGLLEELRSRAAKKGVPVVE